MRRIALGLMLAGAVASGAAALPTAYTYQTLDDPFAGTAFGTVAYGINDTGQVTGWFTDTSNVVHAFLYNGGAWTTIDNNPLNGGGGETQGFGINNSGRIVGAIFDPLGHNALYDGTSWTLLGNDPNDTTNSTSYTGINNSGLMSGIYNSAAGTQAFLYDGSTFATLNNPYTSVTQTVAWGLNNIGEVAGYYFGALPTPLGNFIPSTASSSMARHSRDSTRPAPRGRRHGTSTMRATSSERTSTRSRTGIGSSTTARPSPASTCRMTPKTC